MPAPTSWALRGPCSTSAGYIDKQTCTLVDDKFYLDGEAIAIADTVTYTC